MKRAVFLLMKGFLYTVCFVLIAVLVLTAARVKTEVSWSAGDGKNIISAASDGSGNVNIGIGEKNVKIRYGDIRSLTERITDALK